MKRALYPILAILLTACTAQAPKQSGLVSSQPDITPDYRDITIPSNIAPINFRINNGGDRYVTVFTCGDKEVAVKGKYTDMPLRKWRKLQASGNEMKVDVYAFRNGSWEHYSPFSLKMAEPIDPYISYRLIPPGYQSYEQLTLNQRDITTFRTKVIFCNSKIQSDNDKGTCINCHHYRNYRTDNMQFHARQYKGGTVLVLDGNVQKINLKTDSTRSAGVYPAWHPTHNYIAYSNNTTRQAFAMSGNNRIQGFDTFSDLVLYDIDRDEVSIIENDPDEFECYPAWTPDGRTLYYVSAHFKLSEEEEADHENNLIAHLEEMHYDLYSKRFDPETGTWGPKVKVIDAAEIGRSITLPRVSPDGRYLMFAMGSHGVLHLYNKDADLFLLDLSNGHCRPMREVNSPEAESYHSWSSNGKWVIFSTRRDDGVVTRPYITHFNDDGTFSKPFALPQRDPEHSQKFMLAYNIPEFMIEPVRISEHKFARYVNRHEARPVGFRSKKENPDLQ